MLDQRPPSLKAGVESKASEGLRALVRVVVVVAALHRDPNWSCSRAHYKPPSINIIKCTTPDPQRTLYCYL